MSITPDRNDASYAVTMKDGTSIQCDCVTFARSPGSETMSERRWVFTMPDGRRHVGPLAVLGAGQNEIELIAHEWWGTRQAFNRRSDPA